jgi:hypothetical protein
MRHWVVAVSFALVLPVSIPLRAASTTRPSAASPASLSAHRAMLDHYCVTCHNQKLKTANLTFDTMDLTHVGKDAAVWERAVRKLRGGMMPPPGMPRPDLATVNSFVTFLEASLDQAALESPNPGTVSLHRLNRAEYANAMKDVLGVDVDAAALLPRDDISDGFDNIANVLKVSPSFLDQYISAAREVSRMAIGHPPPTEPVKVVLHGEPADPSNLPLGTQGGIAAEYRFPFDGDYEFTIAGPNPVLTLDGLPVSLNGFVKVKAGLHQLGLTAPAHSFAEPEGMLQSFVPGRAFPGYGLPPGGPGPGGRRAQLQSSVRSIQPERQWRPITARGFLSASRPARAKKIPARPAFSPASRIALSGVPLLKRISLRPWLSSKKAGRTRALSRVAFRTALSRSSPVRSFYTVPSRPRQLSRLDRTIA